MLPPHLKDIKDRIEAKPAQRRTTREQGLLEELAALDSNPTLQKAILTERLHFGTYIVSGPRDDCACCGRPL
jgi:hypothetical protein